MEASIDPFDASKAEGLYGGEYWEGISAFSLSANGLVVMLD